MNKYICAAAALGAGVLGTVPALAQNQTVITTPPAQQAPATVVAPISAQPARETATAGPNALLLHSGLFAFGIPYMASVVVASTSDRSEDKNLYIPVAGPWIDFANRGNCNSAGDNRASEPCAGETAYKVLLVGNGILQTIGALEIMSAFMFPTRTTVAEARPSSPRVVVSPYYVGSGYGLSAFAKF
jgi:hypothetical protein